MSDDKLAKTIRGIETLLDYLKRETETTSRQADEVQKAQREIKGTIDRLRKLRQPGADAITPLAADTMPVLRVPSHADAATLHVAPALLQ